MGQWVKISDEHPPVGRVLNTKISDESGDRNEQELIFKDNLWWLPDMSMYVYYRPTHWWNWII